VAFALLPHIGDIIYKKVTVAANTASTYISQTGHAFPPRVQSRLAELSGQSLDTVDELRTLFVSAGGVHIAGQGMLSRGAIITGLLWGAIAAFCIDRRYLHATAFSMGAALLTLVGFIHTPTAMHLHFNALTGGYTAMAAVFLLIHYTELRSAP
jgi:hypothetical protein